MYNICISDAIKLKYERCCKILTSYLTVILQAVKSCAH